MKSWKLIETWGVILLLAVGAEASPKPTVKDKAAAVAEPFALKDVRLTEGPFYAAMQRNADYLLRVDPDALLSRVREFAGLKPKAEHYGGWEAQGISSHSLGHYLSACAMQYAATGDQRFKQRAVYIVDEMARCQQAYGDGYVTGIPRGREIFAEVAAGNIRSQGFDLNGGWVPWYTMHKLLAGLRDAYLYCDIDRARDVLVGLADFSWSIVDGLTDAQMQKMLACEHGGMNEVAADVYAMTGDDRYLHMAEKFYHKAVLASLAAERDQLAWLHANTQVPKTIGAARLYELTGKPKYKTIAEFFWNRVVHHYSYVNGGNSYDEHFGEPDRFAKTLHDTTETCNTYNMLKLTRHLFAWHPRAELMDFYERALLNHILAHQHPQTGMFVYKGFLDPATHKHFSTPFDSWWCCVGTGMENHTKYGESIYFHSDDKLYVNLFISSELNWPAQRLRLSQKTAWPYGEQTTLTFALDAPKPLALELRHPAWATSGAEVLVNGEVVKRSHQPGSYIDVQRTWRDGDTVTLRFPMSLRMETMPDNEDMLALFYGPTLLAALHENQPSAPVLVGARSDFLSHIKPVDLSKLHFASQGLARPTELDLWPLFSIADQRYTVYLEYYSQRRWREYEAAREAEHKRQRELEARSTDFFQPGQMQPEREHAVTGEKTRTGQHWGRNWRDAYDGGWFSFEMKVDPERPMTLLCTYWGGDGGGRVFDILIDGELVGAQELANFMPGEFITIPYKLPLAATRGKGKVTVRLQARPGRIAGGLFGVRMIRAQEVKP